MIDEKVFDQLKNKFGTDAKAAEALGVSPRHYSRLKIARNAKPSLAKLMMVVAETTKPMEGVADDARP